MGLLATALFATFIAIFLGLGIGFEVWYFEVKDGRSKGDQGLITGFGTTFLLLAFVLAIAYMLKFHESGVGQELRAKAGFSPL
jgi:hypothetical protein